MAWGSYRSFNIDLIIHLLALRLSVGPQSLASQHLAALGLVHNVGRDIVN